MALPAGTCLLPLHSPGNEPLNEQEKVLTLPDASHPRTRVDIDNLRGFCYPINQ